MTYLMEEENHFDLSRLIKDEIKTTEKNRFYTSKLNYQEQINKGFKMNMYSLQTELKTKSVFFPMNGEIKDTYFGAFVNKSNKEELKSGKAGIPRLWSARNSEYNEKIENEYYRLLINCEEKKNSNLLNSPIKNKQETDQIEENQIDYNKINFEEDFKVFKTYPESLDIPQNNILVNALVINPFKMVNYDIKLQESYNNLIYTLDQPSDPRDFYPSLIYLVQGIPSIYFKINEQNLEFELTNTRFRFITCLPELSKNFLDFFMDFGKKMFFINLINEHYIYKQNNSYVIKVFYSELNIIIIQINEKLLKIKHSLMTNSVNLIGLMNSIQCFSNLINLIFHILKLPKAINKYLNLKESEKKIDNLILIYETSQVDLKPHNLIDTLFDYLYTFNHNQTISYFFLKNTLLIILKSFLKYLIYMIFKNELIDQNNEYFLIRKNSLLDLDKSKVPKFLKEYTNILLNHSKLLNLISQYDFNYYEVASLRIEDIIIFIEGFNFEDKFSPDIDINKIHRFIDLKETIFNMKYKMMFMVNEKILQENKIKENEEQMKKLNHLKILKNFMSLADEYNKAEREKEIEKKRKNLITIQNQIEENKQKVEIELRKLKEERIEEKKREEKKKKVEEFIITELKNQYQSIKTRSYNYTDIPILKWKDNRANNKVKRYDLFNEMFDLEKLSSFYPSNYQNIFKTNFHFCVPEEKIYSIDEISSLHKSFTSLNIEEPYTIELDNMKFLNYNHNSMISNEIIPLLIDKVINISINKKENKMYQKDKKIYSEVDDIINKMKVIIDESSQSYKGSKIEIPIQTFLYEFFFDILIKQFKIVNNSFTLMIKNKFHLIYHMNFLNKIFLNGSGDILVNFIESSFDFKTMTLFSNEDEFLSGLIVSEIKRKYPTDSIFLNISNHLRFSRLNKLNLRFSINNIEIAFKVSYTPPEPINFIIGHEVIEVYDYIFKFLFKFKVFQNIISRIFAILKNYKKIQVTRMHNRLNSSLFSAFNLLKSFECFLMTEIFEKRWRDLMKEFNENLDIFYLISLHSDFLGKTQAILKSEILTIVNKLHLRLTQIYIKLFSEDLNYLDLDNEPEINKMIEKLDLSCDHLQKIISNEKVIGDFFNLKYYL